MDKAIFIFDMPDCCGMCPLYNDRRDSCISSGEEVFSYTKIKPDFCPLKPLPKKKIVTADDTTAAVAIKYGWNNCLDEILRDEDYVDR